MSDARIPVYAPDLSGNEGRYVAECIETSWISSKGSFVGRFEAAFGDYVGTSFAAATSNGTTALHLALLALGVRAGDEVIVPTLTYVASANAVVYTGATPVFADSLAGCWQIAPDAIRAKITPRTKAIMPVHLYGAACDMDAILEIAREHDLMVVEDCAEAIGTTYKGRHVGTFGHIASFSFFGNKTITTGEGGMVVTNDQTLHDRATHFKGQGLAAHREYWHDVVGYNYRMTNICAAIGLAQMERIDDFTYRKRALADRYRQRLADLPIEFQLERDGTRHSYWMIAILCDIASDRDALRAHLAAANIETRPLFYPVHTMPMYVERFQQHRVAEEIGRRGICLPSWPMLPDEQLERICDCIRGFYTDRR